MSWMDSWSRPSKSQAVPPPFYLTHPDVRYCQTCGRVMSDRKSHRSETTPAKYCSARCRSQKPREKDRLIESGFVALLNGDPLLNGEDISTEVLDLRIQPKPKGERRLVVPCSAVETLVFGSRHDPSKIYGRKKNRASRAITTDSDDAWTSVDMTDDHTATNESMVDYTSSAFAGKVRPPQHLTEVNGSIGGEKGRAERDIESEEALAKRLEGQRIADERELVKRAARRGCVFGFTVKDGDHDSTRLCEAIMNGKVVEPSFAKGDWGIRWRI